MCRYASSLGLEARQITPAINAAFYRPDGTSYQLQPSFHTYQTEPEPTARARRAGEEFYWTTHEFMFVSFRLLVVESIQAASATMSYFRYSVRAARNSNFADHAFVQKRHKSQSCEYQRRHHPGGP